MQLRSIKPTILTNMKKTDQMPWNQKASTLQADSFQDCSKAFQ